MARQRTNFGERPTGWTRASFDLPVRLVRELGELREKIPGSQAKLVGTAALNLFVALPKVCRDALYRWTYQHALEPERMDPEGALTVVLPLLVLSGKWQPPPAEGKPATGKPVGPPSGGERKPGAQPGTWEIRYPPVERDGYVEEVVVTYRKIDTPGEPGAAGPKGKLA